MEDKARVIRTTENTVFTPGVGAETVYQVTFMVGEHGPFTLSLKRGEFTPERVRVEMEKIAATVRALY
jgi:hypothetical protein